MTTIAATRPTPPPVETPPAPSHERPAGIVLHGISWQLYDMLVNELERQHIRISYDNGEMELMAPLAIHERWKKVIGGLVEMLVVELNIPIGKLGSTTFRLEEVAKGLEPDECYYIQHEKDVRGKMEIDLLRDPPPDLAIEVDNTNSSVPREPIYAGLKVPEIWRLRKHRLEFLWLGPGGYELHEYSAAFPFLASADLQPFLDGWGTMDETTFIIRFRDWVREKFARQKRDGATG
jgi:Uma2 family endonuclease